jgi:glyoxylate reductase
MPAMARVLVTRALPFPALDRLRAEHEVAVWPDPEPPPPATLRELAAGADALLTMLTDHVDGELLDAAPGVRAVANLAVGVDNIDLEAARERGVAVGSTPGVLTDATADLAMALILAITRRLPEGAARVREGRWGAWQPAQDLGADLSGATLGIVGYGRIGRAVAHRAEAFGMRVVHAGRTSGLTLDELLGESDVVSLHVPLSPATHHLIDSVALARMKPTAFLVNTARGGVVDQAALRDALQRRRLAGAALDVTDPEPLPYDDPLLDAPNLLVVPHIGSATAGTRARMAEMAVDNLLAALAGRPMPHPA